MNVNELIKLGARWKNENDLVYVIEKLSGANKLLFHCCDGSWDINTKEIEDIYFGKDLENGKMMLTIIVKNQNGYAVYRFEKINLKYFIWDGLAKKRVFESDDKGAVLMEYEKKEYDDDKYCVLRESKNKI